MKSKTKNICVGLLACACVSAAVGATVYALRQTDGGNNFFSPQLKGEYVGGLTAFADDETQVATNETSAETATFTPSMKGIISKNYDYLLVMANIDDVSKYSEVGFSYALGDGTPVENKSEYYYDAIQFSSGTLVTMSDIFGDTCSGMIVCEYPYNPTADTKITPVLTLKNADDEKPEYSTGTVAKNDFILYNGNFETGNLTGWNLTDGEIVHVTSASTDFDNRNYGKTGNYLIAGTEDAVDGDKQGNGLEGNTGTLVSSDFVIGGSGWITFKFGGGGNPECYVLVKDSEGNVLGKYHNTVTPNEGTLTLYKADLSAHIGKTAHIEIVDNAESAWGCLTADNFITYYENEPANGVEATNYLYQALNGDFETGNLNGWTLSGEIGVISEDPSFWGDKTINNSSRYFRGESVESNSGTLTSSDFVVGGSGWITFKMGAAMPPACYITLQVKNDDGTYSTVALWYNEQFVDGDANIDKPGYALRLVQYKADLNEYMGKTVRIVLNDEATAGFGFFTFDELITYYKGVSELPDDSINVSDLGYSVINGGFETGDLTGWTYTEGGNFGKVSNLTGYWSTNISYEKEGEYLFTGLEGQNAETDPNLEGNTGVLRSTAFILRANGWISFKLGAAKNATTGIRVVDADGNVLASFHNTEFGKDGNEGLMIQYKYQFNNTEDKICFIEIFDNATGDWGLVAVDSIVTDYESEPADGILATKD